MNVYFILYPSWFNWEVIHELWVLILFEMHQSSMGLQVICPPNLIYLDTCPLKSQYLDITL